jgi:hypothetical protein
MKVSKALATLSLLTLNGAFAEEILSRNRRYVTFPQGSTFSVRHSFNINHSINQFVLFQMATCLTVGVLGQPSKGIFTWGVNWGISYTLPNQTESIKGLKRLNKLPHTLVARSTRSEFYSKVELVLNEYVFVVTKYRLCD